VVADDVPNTGSCTWTVSGASTDQARVAIMVPYDVDETGVVPESEFAVSDAFTISNPASVGDGRAAFALHPTNPVTRSFAVSFSLVSGAPATLAVFDVSGRQVASRDVGAGGAGSHRVDLGRLPAGLYVVRLSQAGRSLSSRVAVIR